MKLEETTIYPYIKDDEELCQTYSYNRGQYIVKADEKNAYVWYLISGVVKVEAIAPNGKIFLVDTIPADNYVGHLSNFSQQNFYCNSYASQPCVLIRIPTERFLKMRNDVSFGNHFYSKINARLYDMYKKDLIFHMFPQRQQLAFYLLENSTDGICRINHIHNVCEELRISRRNLYNLIEHLEEDGCLTRISGKDLQISNPEKLAEEASPVYNFYYNKI